jgi:hypothetical protein
MFRLNRNKQKTNRNSLIESIFGYFYENLGLFRFVSKQFCLFRFFRYRFEQFLFFGFTKQTETKPKQILFRFQPKFLFVCFEDTLPLMNTLSYTVSVRSKIQIFQQGIGPSIVKYGGRSPKFYVMCTALLIG